MGKFITGLIIGVIGGILAVTADPNLPQELRISLASLTAVVMRRAEETAEELGDAAEDLADGAGETAESVKPPAEGPVAPADGRETGQSL
jgi:gas vesicle protein